MRIKRLELHGFKSFADKTEIELADGITAIVGPNGSGKSNLADAIKWVLGEQSVKSLRGTRMDEVIFAGTKVRRGLGLAEVSMVFDNTNRSFPLAFNEVAITRRVFKSGESDYYLNQAACRLKDVQELFLDTGVGKEAYSFIGQGRIDELLSAKPEERRAILEEVAGIARYKARKRETTNKLADAESALTRVRDLLHELENQLEPLKEEAVRAQQYLQLESARRAVEKDLILYELNMAERRRQRDEKLRQQAADQILQAEHQVLHLEAEEERSRLQQAEQQERINNENQQLYLLGQQVERLQGDRRIVSARSEERQGKVTELTNRQAVLLARKVELDKQRAMVQEQLAAVQTAISGKSADLQTLEQSLQAAGDKDIDQELQATEQALAEYLQLRQTAEMAASLWSDRSTRAEQELDALHENVLQAEAEATGLAEQVAGLRTELQTISGEWQQLAAEQQRLETERQAAETLLAQSSRRERQAGQELAAVGSRLRLLQDMVDQLEGYQRGVRALMQAKKQGDGSLGGLVGVVGDLLTVPTELEYAIEIALGGSLQFMVTETEADAKQGIQYLKRTGAGRATFLPLDVITPRAKRPVDHTAAGMAGAIGFAADLVSFAPAVQNVMQNLLGNILVVKTLDEAVQIARATRHQVRMVTVDGDMLLPGGSLSGGSRQRQGSGFLGRQRELTNLTKEQERLQALIKSERQASVTANRQLEQLTGQVRGLVDRVRAVENRQSELQSTLAAEQSLLTARQKQLESLRSTHALALQQLASCQSELTQAEQQAAAASQALATAEQTLAAQKAANAEQLQQRMARMEQCHRLEVELSSLREQALSLSRQSEGLSERLQEEEANLQEISLEQERLQTGAAADQMELTDLSGRVEGLLGQQQTQAEQLEQARRTFQELEESERLLRQQTRSQREQVESLKTGLYTTELRLSRLENECETMRARLETDYQLVDLTDVHSTLQSRSQGEEQLEQLKEQIVLLGPVRVSAISELERLQERVGFLNSQQQDLLDSRLSLEQIIQEIDQLMAKRFLDAFKEVRRAFQRMFVELFDGGEADLKLVDPNRPLESGIDILAQPPGKNLQNISLLSGGEKALTAVALLCAVLEIKPTPFCVLDEIDAPLDDANTRRLMKVVRRLSSETQFLLITHSKETMLGSDTLYGVTMPERGISQLISVKLTEAGNN